MMNQNEAENALNKFVRTVSDAMIDQFKKIQASLGAQQDIRDSKRFKDTDFKLMLFSDVHRKFFETPAYREKMLDVLNGIRSRRMGQYNAQNAGLAPEDQAAYNAALAPYVALLEPVAELRKLQAALVTHGKLKNLRVPYVEITAKLDEIGALVTSMPRALTESLLQIKTPEAA